MLFNSITFFYLVILTFTIYYILPRKKWQLGILVFASFTFYAWNYPVLLLLLIFSILINAASSYQVAHHLCNKKQRIFASLGVVLNIGILALFKYGGLIGTTFLNQNKELVDYLVSIPLPVGISFFTFQGISLVVDTFRKDSRLRSEKQINQSFIKHLVNTSLFISLFPQLVAGPIVKAHDFFPQIKAKYFKDIDWRFVFQHLVIGYFLKMVVADNLKDFTFELTWPYFDRLSSIHLITLLFAYSMQIFADFAGYSLIAIGLSALFGYRIPENFKFPYIASSFSEFWKRWHISLSSFLKEYLYIPLGGNRRGKIRTYINLIIVMVLGGLWHGAAWSYMIWGFTHGVLLAMERLIANRISTINWFKSNSALSQIHKISKVLWVFSWVSVAWLLFKLSDFTHVIKYFNALVNNGNKYTDPLLILYILTYSVPVVLYHFHHLMPFKWLPRVNLKPVAIAIMLFLLITNSGSPQDFIYFQF
jgi:alginate O-acetyltransferase complex protein AlgI